MEVNLIDLRKTRGRSKISRLLAANKASVTILLGHGSRDSLGGCDLGMLGNIPNAKILWLYACECGLSLIHKLAPKYLCAFGYATEVLAPETVESTVAYKLREILRGYSDEVTPDNVANFVQEGLLGHAVKILRQARTKGNQNGLYLVQAALVNHTRLSLRIARYETPMEGSI